MKTLDRLWLATVIPDPGEREDLIAEGIAEICQDLMELRTAVVRQDTLAARPLACHIKDVAAKIGAGHIGSTAGLLEDAAREQRQLTPLFFSLSEAVDALVED